MIDRPQIDLVARRIADAVHPTRIYLFGSRATGDAHPDSDVDLLVIYDGPKSKREVDLEIRNLFWPREFSIDILILSSAEMERYAPVANTLAREVSERGVLLYG